MEAYTILFLNADIEYSMQLSKSLNLPSNTCFTYADSGMQALSHIIDRKISLIIAYEKLSHKISGIEVCELLMKKEETSSIPIIFLRDQQKKIPECTNIKKYLPKDSSSKTLEQEIQKHYKLLYKTQSKKEDVEKNMILSIVNRIHSPIFIIDHEKVSFANQYFLDFLQLSSIDEFSKTYPNIQELFFHEKGKEGFSHMQWIKELLESNEDQYVIMENAQEDQIHLKLRGELLEHSNEYLIITQDISTELTHEKEIEQLYSIDHLTKLPNRLKLLNDLEEYDDLALAILDIDDFKVINDFYGHLIGDYVIGEVAKRISNYISHENLVLYRLPSDSFAILNKNHIEKEYFEIIIISLIQIIEKTAFHYSDEEKNIEVIVNLSAGIAFEKKFVLAHADLALREAKKMHKDYVVYHDNMRQEIHNKNNLEWIHKIKLAITNDKIVPYFQPIVDNKTQKTIKYECLVRLINEEDEVISPYFFLDVAKHAKLYEPITKMMIKKSFQTFSNNHYEFSINLSIEDIIDYNLFEYIKNMLAIYPLANRVCFEILETEKIENYQVISDFVNEVRELGCKVSIDDFGSGYSNFSHLLNLNFDYLKIDASLIKNIHLDKHKQIIVKTIVTFAQELDIKTIGEYVESKEIYDFITQMGITYSQGYYFSPPVDTIE